ncbi:hypothetical protein T4D_16792 [Trichinella pseudospiralis]|uniref:Uncharacterized protein n=1 Tax=Trichinella pseudospiralis TaxID=6337 RepID=A0A0V1G479_TRIPS|nr:hypothetical protein T4D_16792 [Trichinella pseudospiralis]
MWFHQNLMKLLNFHFRLLLDFTKHPSNSIAFILILLICYLMPGDLHLYINVEFYEQLQLLVDEWDSVETLNQQMTSGGVTTNDK